MASPVIIYSIDEIRGRIIWQSLRAAGIGALLYSTNNETLWAAEKYSPEIFVIDTKGRAESESEFLKDLSYLNPGATFLIPAGGSDIPVIKGLRLPRARLLPDPLDPELIVSLAGEVFTGVHPMKEFAGRIKDMTLLLMRGFLRALPFAVSLIIGLVGGYVYWCISTVPAIEALESYTPYEASELYSRDNVLLTEFYVERRRAVRLHEVPDDVVKAFVAAEDTRYYEHGGIDVFRIFGALIRDIREGAFVEGGSTITQQLAKMLFLKPEKTITRKIREIVLAFQLESRCTKDEILEMYLNKAYFGSWSYGIEAAAGAYFGKSVKDLTVPEAALLAALPKAPSLFSPFKNRQRAKDRRDYVLHRMFEMGYITEKEYRRFLEDPLPVEYHGHKYKAPYFTQFCKKVLEGRYGKKLHTSGLKIYSTLDFRKQVLAEKAVENGLREIEKRVKGDVQAALLAVDLTTGGIEAMVGGEDFWASQFNRVTQAMRQPGSAFKPIVYLAALEKGYKPGHRIDDRMTTYMTKDGAYAWTPRNYGEVYHRRVTLREALSRSLNAATVRVAKKVGLARIISMAKRLGIESTIHTYYSSALGASEMTLLELVYAYGAIAKGTRMTPTCTRRIIDREKLAFTAVPARHGEIARPRVLADIRSMLRSVVEQGTGRRAMVLDRKVYGKTGTSNDNADAWFVGFDADTVTGVWVGRDDRVPIGEGETGSRAALPIWVEYMGGEESVPTH